MREGRRSHFLAEIIEADLESGRLEGPVVTRFPPEPNGFLHIGHAKSIALNFGLAAQFGGRCHLRFDDTNPTTEETAYVESIQEDVRWLGFDWGEHLHYASDYFPRMYECALRLIREKKAYVDSQGVEAIREQRGSFEAPGVESPHRNRSVEENLALFERMRAGELPDGSWVLRAKIDMAHANLLLRDPLLYRIRHATHHRTGDTWCIYPMYDFAHPLEDAFEGVTHSICTLEFETNRELYDWVLDNLGPWDPRPRQYEFARLSLGFTVMSKRKLLQLVNERYVSGWDDPRMPTIAGMRRRGVTPKALRDFAELIGVAKHNSLVDLGKLEFSIRADLEKAAPRAMAVLEPLRVTLTNWDGEDEAIELPYWPGDPARGGVRKVFFGRELLIEKDDFAKQPPQGFKRLSPGREVRLNGAYVIRCDEVIEDASGEAIELRCSVDRASRGGETSDGRKVGATIHWVHAARSIPAPVRLYDRLFRVEQPDADGDFLPHLNPDSLRIPKGARIEAALASATAGQHFQFLRLGYFFVDPIDSRPDAPVFHRVIGLKDSWAKSAEVQRPTRAEKKPRVEAAPKKSRAELRAELRASVPKLAERFARYQDELGLSAEDAELLCADEAIGSYFEQALAAHPNPKSVSRWLLNDLTGLAPSDGVASLPLAAKDFGRFVALVDQGKVPSAAGKHLLATLAQRGGDPEEAAKSLGLEQEGDVDGAAAKVVQERPHEAARYRAGETKLLGVFIGAAMRELKGAADPVRVREAIARALG